MLKGRLQTKKQKQTRLHKVLMLTSLNPQIQEQNKQALSVQELKLND
jgi:hypothetical protein